MSGHSHWHSIKHQKGKEDQKKGRLFSKLARLIAVAARNGVDPEFNPKLRQAIEEAKQADMPKDNIEKAIERGAGKDAAEELEEVCYEAIGPGGVGLILEGITDNANRTLSEIRQILKKHNAKPADEGAIKYLFNKKGIILISPKPSQIFAKGKNLGEQEKEALELQAIEAGAEDINWNFFEDKEVLEVITPGDQLYNVKQGLEQAGVEIESADLGWVAKGSIAVSDENKAKIEALFEELDEHDDIQEIYSNATL